MKQVTRLNERVAIERETLTDNSHVWNVIYNPFQDDKVELRFACIGEENAGDLAEQLCMVVDVELDL